MNSSEIAFTHASKCVLVWPWAEAPPEFQALSRSGGDEDYVAWFPPGFSDYFLEDKLTSLSCCNSQVNHQLDGSIVVIGSHA